MFSKLTKSILTKHTINRYLLIGFIWALLLFDLRVRFHSDNAPYILLAKSFAENKTYSDIWNPTPTGYTHFPPLFPLFLSPFVYFFGTNIIVLKLSVLLLYLLSIYIIYKLLNTITNIDNSLNIFFAPVISSFILNDYITSYSSMVRSEMLYIALSLSCIYFLFKYDTSHKQHSTKRYYLYLSIIFLVLSVYTRSIGISLLFAFLVYFILKKEYRFIILWVLVLLPVCIYWDIKPYLENKKSHRNTTHIEYFLSKDSGETTSNKFNPFTFLKRLAQNTIRSSFNIGKIVARYLPPLWLFISIIFIIGLIKLKSTGDFFCFLKTYILIYLLIILLWPRCGERFWVPIAPLILFFLYYGSWYTANRFWKVETAKKLFSQLILIIIIPNTLVGLVKSPFQWKDNIQMISSGIYHTESKYRELIKSALWAKTHTPEHAIFLTKFPIHFCLFAERKCIDWLEASDIETAKFQDYIAANKITHILALFDGDTEIDIKKYLDALPKKEVIYKNFTEPKIIILKLH